MFAIALAVKLGKRDASSSTPNTSFESEEWQFGVSTWYGEDDGYFGAAKASSNPFTPRENEGENPSGSCFFVEGFLETYQSTYPVVEDTPYRDYYAAVNDMGALFSQSNDEMVQCGGPGLDNCVNQKNCGMCYQIKCIPGENDCLDPEKVVEVQVVDACPAGPGGQTNPRCAAAADAKYAHFDISKTAMEALAGDGGLININWKKVECSGSPDAPASEATGVAAGNESQETTSLYDTTLEDEIDDDPIDNTGGMYPMATEDVGEVNEEMTNTDMPGDEEECFEDVEDVAPAVGTTEVLPYTDVADEDAATVDVGQDVPSTDAAEEEDCPDTTSAVADPTQDDDYPNNDDSMPSREDGSSAYPGEDLAVGTTDAGTEADLVDPECDLPEEDATATQGTLADLSQETEQAMEMDEELEILYEDV